jgi:ketosteroid isomerase-like protein
MSHENVEIVRELLEAFARRDHERPFEFYDADIEWDASEQGLITDSLPVLRRLTSACGPATCATNGAFLPFIRRHRA